MVFVVLLASAPAAAQVVITVDPTIQYQTWEAWEVTVEGFHMDDQTLGDENPVPQDVINGVINDAVNYLGITGLRFDVGVMASRTRPMLELTNDNDDPFVLNDAGIRWHWVDPYLRTVVVPFKDAVEAQGDALHFNVTAVAWNAWHWDEPASDPGQEYAELMLAFLQRAETKFGLAADMVAVYNEPDNSNATETKPEVVRGMAKLSARMQAAGYIAPFSFPDVSFLNSALPWFDYLETNNPSLLSSTGYFSFHGYSHGFASDTYATLRTIRSRAQARGLRTAMTEWWFTNNHAPDIYAALTQADVVMYEPYALGMWPFDGRKGGLHFLTYNGGTFPRYNYTGHIRSGDWYEIYQYSAFIRPGDVRIDAVADDTAILPVAFAKPDGRHTVVAYNAAGSARDVSIQGLAAGTYHIAVTAPVSGTSPVQKGEEQTPIAVSAGGTLSFTIPGDGVATFYQGSSPSSPGMLQFGAASATVAEDGGTISVNVSRIGGSAGDVTVDYATSDGSALAGSDYTAAAGTLTFADGEVSKTITVNVLDDVAVELAETILITLSNPAGGALLGTNSATVTILDNDGSAPDLIAHWPLDDGSGSSALDASGNNNTGTLSNSPQWGAGVVGGGLHFDGANDYVQVANESNFDIPASWSIALWLQRGRTLTNERLVNKPGDANFFEPFFDVQFDIGSDALSCSFYSTNSTWVEVAASAEITDSTWHHAACVFDSAAGELLVYIDGAQVGVTSTPESPLASNQPVYLGAADPSHEPFLGGLDDIRVYGRVLTDTEIATLAASSATCSQGEIRSCYSGPSGTDGVGLCSAGTETCSGGAWGSCDGEVTPAVETCDGQDNDCDGEVDEGCGCANGNTRACYTGPSGTLDVGLCSAGTETCTSGAWGSCVGQTTPTADLCDGHDNDCDGAVDEDCACSDHETQACYGGAAGTEGIGPCGAGTQTCVHGFWGSCVGQTLPQAEACGDDVDNDCDGLEDQADTVDCPEPERVDASSTGCSSAGAPSSSCLVACFLLVLGVVWRRSSRLRLVANGR